jgi:hypothetical protein
LPGMAELGGAELDHLVEQAIVDGYGDDEQLTAFATLIGDNLALPFMTSVLGVQAQVRRVDLTDSGIVAICVRGAHRQAVPILGLPLPVPAPAGAEWIAAFRHWAGGR